MKRPNNALSWIASAAVTALVMGAPAAQALDPTSPVTAGAASGADRSVGSRFNADTNRMPPRTRDVGQPPMGDATPGTVARQPNNRNTSSAGAPSVTVTPLMVVLVPQALVDTPDYAKGCWVRFYDNEDFRGRSVTLSGPVEVPDADQLQQVWHDWDSAIVGPKANVQVWDNDDFHDKLTTLKAGQRYRELDNAKLGLFGQINSLRVSCTNS